MAANRRQRTMVHVSRLPNVRLTMKDANLNIAGRMTFRLSHPSPWQLHTHRNTRDQSFKLKLKRAVAINWSDHGFELYVDFYSNAPES